MLAQGAPSAAHHNRRGRRIGSIDGRFERNAPRPPQFSPGRGVSSTRCFLHEGACQRREGAPPKHARLRRSVAFVNDEQRGTASDDFCGSLRVLFRAHDVSRCAPQPVDETVNQ